MKYALNPYRHHYLTIHFSLLSFDAVTMLPIFIEDEPSFGVILVRQFVNSIDPFIALVEFVFVTQALNAHFDTIVQRIYVRIEGDGTR
jgi:hypothetical protein